MKLWELSVRRPIFMSSLLVALMVVGTFSLMKLPVELFPDVTFPIVTVTTVYPGAGPSEIELLVSKPVEEELSGIAGAKVIRSINRESVSQVIAEFNLEIDIKYAEQQVRDRVSSVKSKLPDDIEEPVIRKVDPSAQPIMYLTIQTDLKGGDLYDLANEVIRPKIEQVNQVGRVDVIGVRKREIQIQLDRQRLRSRELSVMQVVQSLQRSGENIPAGKISQGSGEKVYRTLGEFSSLSQISNSLVSFFGNDVTTRVKDIGQVVDTLEDEKMRAFVNGQGAAMLQVYKQSGANTVKVSNALLNAVEKLNALPEATGPNGFRVQVVSDMSKFIRANVLDVTESIVIGVLLTIVVVFLFLGSFRSTLITGLAIPVSLIGGMAFISAAGLTINMMTLLAFSLSVGLLIDDAIVVRENIFRHLMMGKSTVRAALDGTSEVALAVIAVTLAVVAVFGPIAFLSGVVGQFFKSFGLGVCFVMLVSLFDALTNASMLSAYLGGGHTDLSGVTYSWRHPIKSSLLAFDRLQVRLEKGYEKWLRLILAAPLKSLAISGVVVLLLASTVKFIPKTFLPPQDSGEFAVSLEIKPGSSLDEMAKIALEVDQVLRENPEVNLTSLRVGDLNGRSFVAEFYVLLQPFGERDLTTTEVKAQVRERLREFAYANPKVKDVDFVGAGQRPFTINIRGQNIEELRTVAQKFYEKLKAHPGLLDPDISDKPGLPEFQIDIDKLRALEFGVTPMLVGGELRAQIEGLVPAKFRERGLEYDIRVRLRDDQRDLSKEYNQIEVPNVNYRLVKLSQFSKPKEEIGFATINREDRARYISIEADVTPNGPGMGGVISDINTWTKNGEIELPPGVTYRFVGQAENFQELAVSMLMAAFLAVVFIYLVLASLYESLVTPFVIMLVIPLAVIGGFFGLFVMRSSLDLFSMIGCIMLMGLATKNSIILVDYINQKLAQGMSIHDAIVEGGKTRLRPIIMTSMALMAGMLPVAIGLNEASSQRKSLGIAVIGGVFVSTLLTLVVIPAVFNYIERARRWMIANVGSKIVKPVGE
jgi:HAE1 family hydrophobic/amphiphilic exporter-1